MIVFKHEHSFEVTMHADGNKPAFRVIVYGIAKQEGLALDAINDVVVRRGFAPEYLPGGPRTVERRF
jgi:hypothetical protein